MGRFCLCWSLSQVIASFSSSSLVLIVIGVVSTGSVLFVIVVTSCVVCRRRNGRRRQRDNRRNSRTEALKRQNEALNNQVEALRSQNEAINVTSKDFERQIAAFDSRTEVLKALTSQSDNGGAAVCRPEVPTKPSTSHPVKTSSSSVANGSASAATVAGYRPVACLSPHNNKVSLFLLHPGWRFSLVVRRWSRSM